ncbi:hypothetical protein THRCLA_22233 [Thraustotheca clavata]|uniref:Uncharacterized protein n=1 Tax=Thraustotheca clavata TaxID=74557 RepID=A0A1V9Z8Y9_9STRA|nr:hypothetical protein THRCLA_22233 [Thraustotheca clavata]
MVLTSKQLLVLHLDQKWPYSNKYANQCECLAAKCKSNKVQCYVASKSCDATCLKKASKCKPGLMAPNCDTTKVNACASLFGGKTIEKFQKECFLNAATCINSKLVAVLAAQCKRTKTLTEVTQVAVDNSTTVISNANFGSGSEDTDLEDDIP